MKMDENSLDENRIIYFDWTIFLKKMDGNSLDVVFYI
jgi:hypothetical protein